MRHRIGFLITRMDIGGTEKILYSIIEGVEDARFKKSVFFIYSPGKLGKRLIQKGYSFYSGLMKNRFDLSGFFRAMRAIKKEDPEILYTVNQPISQILCVIASILLGKKIILGYHSFKPLSRAVFRNIVDIATLHFYDRIVALSPSHKRFLMDKKRVDEKKIIVINNALNIRDFRNKDLKSDEGYGFGLKNGSRVVGMVGSLRKEKGYSYFLEAAKEVLKKRQDVSFLIVGDGPEGNGLKSLARSLGIYERVKFLGLVEDIYSVIKEFDVAVLSSICEAFPISILEYMAASKPIVATDVGCVSEMIEDRKTALLVKPGDSQALSKRILFLLNNPSFCKELAENAWLKLESEFLVSCMIEKYESLFLNESKGF